MKHCRYYPEFNAREYGPAEKRADRYWKKRKVLIDSGKMLTETKETKKHAA